ncbi:MAG: response regulator transcription factor [Bacteroidota bacterium]
MPIRIAIIEDDPDIRQLLRLLLNGSPGYECQQVFGSCEEGIPSLKNTPPDILLMDIDLPGISGIQGVKQLRGELPELNIIMLTVHEDDEAVFTALCAGAIGYLVKGLPPVQLLRAIDEAQQGGAPMSPGIARRIVHSFRPPSTPSTLSHNLSTREREVLAHLCEGDNYSTIAQKLFISGNTVRSHIKSIYKKLEVNSRATAVLKANREGLIG